MAARRARTEFRMYLRRIFWQDVRRAPRAPEFIFDSAKIPLNKNATAIVYKERLVRGPRGRLKLTARDDSRNSIFPEHWPFPRSGLYCFLSPSMTANALAVNSSGMFYVSVNRTAFYNYINFAENLIHETSTYVWWVNCVNQHTWQTRFFALKNY